MNNNKEILAEKVAYLEGELKSLEGYHRVVETYDYLRSELDYHLMLLKKIESRNRLSAIESRFA